MPKYFIKWKASFFSSFMSLKLNVANDEGNVSNKKNETLTLKKEIKLEQPHKVSPECELNLWPESSIDYSF